jgi:hypothetical protein
MARRHDARPPDLTTGHTAVAARQLPQPVGPGRDHASPNAWLTNCSASRPLCTGSPASLHGSDLAVAADGGWCCLGSPTRLRASTRSPALVICFPGCRAAGLPGCRAAAVRTGAAGAVGSLQRCASECTAPLTTLVTGDGSLLDVRLIRWRCAATSRRRGRPAPAPAEDSTGGRTRCRTGRRAGCGRSSAHHRGTP